ncbi:transcription factor bHLH104-like [Malania oleifera]|uniref:transcription factor bHLH104-like n=1 Tax=Malania oleifera TaxID=397392 RepID=UPI0025ADD8CA|nr:transcription factor bHLH104-like [Malania oleifera]
MESFDDSSWDFLDYSIINDTPSTDLSWITRSAVEIDFPHGGVASQQQKECRENDSTRKRGHSDSWSRGGTKACREKLRREKLNDRFSDLSSTLEPGRPAKTDKLTILSDAIQVVNQLRTEAQELKEANEKLLDDIKSLKAEKNELREEKLKMKTDKERLEQQLKVMTMRPAGFMPAHPTAYHAGASKMPVFPGYGLIPMWQCLPPSTLDTSHDHELRPPAA